MKSLIDLNSFPKTLKQVNDFLKASKAHTLVVKGNGYFYWDDMAAELPNINVNRVSHLTYKQWLEEYKSAVSSKDREQKEIDKFRNNPKKIADRIEKLAKAALKKKGKRTLFYGDCGQFAYALCKYLNDPDMRIGFLGSREDADDVDDLLKSDVAIYHAYVEYKGMMFDALGQTDIDDVYGEMEGSGMEEDCQEWEDLKPDAKTLKFLTEHAGAKNTWQTYVKIFEAAEKVKKKIEDH